MLHRYSRDPYLERLGPTSARRTFKAMAMAPIRLYLHHLIGVCFNYLFLLGRISVEIPLIQKCLINQYCLNQLQRHIRGSIPETPRQETQ